MDRSYVDGLLIHVMPANGDPFVHGGGSGKFTQNDFLIELYCFLEFVLTK